MRREHESWGEGWIMPASVLAFLVFRNAMRSPTANVWEVLLTMAGVAFGAWAALVVVAFALATIGWLFNRWCEARTVPTSRPKRHSGSSNP